jgi:serine/threonine protein kinase
MIGQTILHYKILEKLGEGGMGEVYKAQDTKLDRFVALKFLPSQLTASEDDKARFIQEAKAASSMNHPNVCTIYSIEEYEKQLFIAMEYVEGKTLKDKKDSLAEKQKLEISVQVAEGLAAAHEKGIVHRDIKPENIMIRKDGIAQIMDFGLAKLYTDKNASRLTKVGTTMGTLGYMSPEQIQGQDVDHRTDIFSFGIVLYEMFAGESPFKGIHETAIMYEIVNVDAPPLSSVKNNIDPELDRIILECLEKDKDERCQSAKELAKDLRKIKKSTGQRKSRVYNVNSDIAFSKTRSNQDTTNSGAFSIEILNRRVDFTKFFGSRSVPWLIAIVSICIAVFLWLRLNKPAGPKTITTFTINTGENNLLDVGAYRALTISHDGNKIAYSANGQLYLRKMDQIEPILLTGTENSSSPFFSADDKWIAFTKDKKLEKISISGGVPSIITDIGDNRGADWGKDGTIVYTPNTTSGLYLISENGGEPKKLTTPDTAKSERTHRWPSFLPDGKHVLFTVGSLSSPTYYEDASIDVVNIETGERKNVLKGASTAKYIDPGYIIYSSSGILYAIPFDPNSLEVKGQPLPVLQDVSGGVTSGAVNYSIADNGTIIFIQGAAEYAKRNIVKIDLQGNITIIDSSNHILTEPAISPDNKSIAFTSTENKTVDVWIYDIARKTFSKLTFGGENRTPKWSPDGKEIAYSKLKNDGENGIFIKPSDGSGAEREIYSQKNRIYIDDWTKDGQFLICETITPGNLIDITLLPLKDSKKTVDFVTTKGEDYNAKNSPDGRWTAYVTNESGSYQLYVRPFINNNIAGKWQVSNDGGIEPVWAPDGKTLYYRVGGTKLMGVPVFTSPTISFGIPKVITDNFPAAYTSTWISYDITSDGKYFITTSPASLGKYNKIAIILNFNSEVEHLFITQ